MKGLILALQFLTRLPTPSIRSDANDFARSMCWFPAVGLVIGAILAAVGWAIPFIDPWLGALAVLAAWVGLTGALHLDGLGDIADARGAAHKDREKLLAVLADPHVGSFAIVAITLQLLTKLVLLHALFAQALWLPLLLVPFAARIGPLYWTLSLPPLHDGLAARFRAAVRPAQPLLWSLVLIAGAAGAPAILTAFLLIPLWSWRVRTTFGGISGDSHGAGIELVETGLLAALVIQASLP